MLDEPTKIRLDKWLWAARFFKTRSLAKQAIEAGHVIYNNQKVKVSKEVSLGAMLKIRQGYAQKTVQVMALSAQRQSAVIAQQLYLETEQSIAEREQSALQRKLTQSTKWSPTTKPDKKSRRQITAFKQLRED